MHQKPNLLKLAIKNGMMSQKILKYVTLTLEVRSEYRRKHNKTIIEDLKNRNPSMSLTITQNVLKELRSIFARQNDESVN